jgi:hypothetical protein
MVMNINTKNVELIDPLPLISIVVNSLLISTKIDYIYYSACNKLYFNFFYFFQIVTVI